MATSAKIENRLCVVQVLTQDPKYDFVPINLNNEARHFWEAENRPDRGLPRETSEGAWGTKIGSELRYQINIPN